MKVRQYASRILFAVVLLMLVLALSSCQQKAEEQNVTLGMTTTSSGAKIPVVSGLSKSDEINKKLEKIFTPYAEQARQTEEDSEGRLEVVYEWDTSDSAGVFGKKYNINMNISDGTDSLEIVTVHVSDTENFVVDVPQSLEWLDSADLTESAIAFKHIGMEVDLTNLDELAGEEFTTEMFIRLYETFTGEGLDVSDIKVGDEGGDMLKKALKLRLITGYGDYHYEYSPDVYLYNVLNMASAVINDIERDVYGRQGETVTGGEFADMLRTFYDACRVHETQQDSDDSWAALGDVDFHAMVSEMELAQDCEFSRRDGAELVCRIANAGPSYGRNYNDDWLDTVDDSDSIWVRRAVTYGFMDYYGDSVLFAPDENFTVTNALKNAKTFVVSRYIDWSFADKYQWDGRYDKADVLTAVGKAAAYFADRPEEDKNHVETKLVLNDRDYDWFLSQKNTGFSSSVNCMPTIAAMATRWYDQNSTVTVLDMRNTDSTAEGWTVNELRHALDVYHVPYTSDLASINKFVSLLDEGKIILAQYSDRPYTMTGHCYVIYGYKKWNNSVTFIINDSDSVSYMSEIYGRPNGNGDEVEANFAMWSIDRFYNVVTVIG